MAAKKASVDQNDARTADREIYKQLQEGLGKFGQELAERVLELERHGAKIKPHEPVEVCRTADSAYFLSRVPIRRPGRLAPRELQVAELVSRGLMNSEIALELNIKLPTVNETVQRLIKKVHGKNRVHIARYMLFAEGRGN